jgi:hypothetical protein
LQGNPRQLGKIQRLSALARKAVEASPRWATALMISPPNINHVDIRLKPTGLALREKAQPAKKATSALDTL